MAPFALGLRETVRKPKLEVNDSLKNLKKFKSKKSLRFVTIVFNVAFFYISISQKKFKREKT